MKKFFIILIFLIYGSATMGATIHMHYCMNKYMGGSLWHDKDDNRCGKCGMMEKEDDCCKDEHKQAKLTIDQQQTATQIIEFSEVPVLIHSCIDIADTVPAISINYPATNSPPKAFRGRLYILNCVFLI